MIAPNRRDMLKLGAGAASAAFLSGESAGASSSDRIIVGVQSIPRTLEPARDNSNITIRIGYNVYENLIGAQYGGESRVAYVPRLATSWRMISPTVLELTLRGGVKFHDGAIMSAEDVAFSFGQERMFGNGAPGAGLSKSYLGTIERVEAVDPLTVRIVTRRADPLIEKRIAAWMGQIISKRAYLAAPSLEAWERQPIGTGPYKVESLRVGDRATLVAHDDYWGGRPLARRIEFREMPELPSRLNALAVGEVDIITELTIDSIKVVEAMAGRRVAGGPILNLRTLIYDKNHPVLRDPRIRQALNLSIDRKAIVDSLYEARIGVLRGHQHPSFGAMYLSDWPGPAFDPDRARALLSNAGYKGQAIPYRLLSNYYALQSQTAQVLIEMWRSVGLNVLFEAKENWNQILEPEGRGIRDTSNSIFWQDPMDLIRFYGPNSALQVRSKEWTNEEFNRYGEVLETSLDLEERRAAFRGALNVYENIDPVGIALHEMTLFYGMKSSLKWTPYPVEAMDFGPGNFSFA